MSIKVKDRSWTHRGARLRGVKSLTSRLGFRFIIFAALVTIYHCLDLHIRYRNSMRAKYSATQFTKNTGYYEADLSRPSWETGRQSEPLERVILLENKKNWKRLGGGREGEVFIYNNSVIKVYDEESSPFRNCMQSISGNPKRWPTEIPASLIMGGHDESLSALNDDSQKDMFVPVKDYFLAASGSLQSPKWHLVTPFYKEGTLSKLAKKLRTSDNPPSYHEIDMMFRPSFESLLSALDHLHQTHNLCHDDIKMDNIFVASEHDPRRWKVGDLGNAREPEHPYHFTPLWTADTPQLRDCRANDALRLVKSYLKFVRIASGNPEDFDVAFFQGVEPVSRLYWTMALDKSFILAEDARQLSRAFPPLRDDDSAWWAGMDSVKVKAAHSGVNALITALVGWNVSLGRAVTEELRVGAKEVLGQMLGLTGIMGVPISPCQTV
ncbi:uncharacterized protein CTRU02_208487 [Colletotrichum truncatum]|uniref:Uncharacterized protein n=1 Tax=Colletotrichum truncatum TaxID=5467 RepID=A0ACC3YZD9_COLTU|nr:uncharacterized protein CTRU02_10241 [Colletotrichum truncatum]KAF6787445.1 hypothetical protein CTRU02_10241 [Colletotrichum truncatum]